MDEMAKATHTLSDTRTRSLCLSISLSLSCIHSPTHSHTGVDKLQAAVDEMAEAKLISITIPDEIPENRVIKYDVPGHG